MITTIIILAAIIIIGLLWIKAKAASRKTPESRSALESILVTLFVMHRKNLEDTANSLRTAEVSRTEGLQKCKDAIEDLRNSFLVELQTITKNRDTLKDSILPSLKKKPGYYKGKAGEAKRKYEEYIKKSKEADARHPEKFVEQANKAKSQSLKYLAFRKKAIDRIDKAEDMLQNIGFTMEDTKMAYESHKMELDDLQQELEMMIGDISTAKFNESITLIRSIKDETAGKLREQNARIEAEQWINGQQSDSDNSISDSEFTDDFDKL